MWSKWEIWRLISIHDHYNVLMSITAPHNPFLIALAMVGLPLPSRTFSIPSSAINRHKLSWRMDRLLNLPIPTIAKFPEMASPPKNKWAPLRLLKNTLFIPMVSTPNSFVSASKCKTLIGWSRFVESYPFFIRTNPLKLSQIIFQPGHATRLWAVRPTTPTSKNIMDGHS